jgi:tetratricopeptide (TPR) repeat protein
MLKILSECHYSLENYQEAIAYLSQMLLFDEKDEWALMLIQKCYDKIERTDLQLEYLNKLLAIKPDDVSYLKATATALRQTKQYEKALEHLFHLDILKPENPDTMLSIVSCAIRLKKFDVALRYNQAILLTDYKKKDLVYLYAGHTHFLMGDWKEALANYKKFKAEVEAYDNKEDMQQDPADEFYASTLILEEMGISSSDIQLMYDMIQL